jgi:DNA polymerase-1
MTRSHARVNLFVPTCERENDRVNLGEPSFAITEDRISYIGANATKVHQGSPRYELSKKGSPVITDPNQARVLAEELAGQQFVGLDLETTGLDPHSDQIRLVQLATKEKTFIVDAYQVPVEALRPVLAGGPIKIGQNLKFDWQFLYAQGIFVEPVFDTMLADQVIHNRNFGRNLGVLAKEYLGLDLPKELQKSDWSGALTEQQMEYAARDAAILPHLAKVIMAKAREAKLETAIHIENASLPAIAWMEYNGVGFDLDSWEALAEEAQQKVAELRNRLTELIKEQLGGLNVDWESTQQVLQALKALGLKIADTKQETLEGLRDSHPIIPVLLDYREMTKRAGTYGADWLKHINKHSGRLHPDWRQIGAESGRMACKEPNLQNLPRMKAYRACFHANPGNVLIKVDYSQIELRIAAEISGDRDLLKAFQNHQDIHALAATYITGKEASKVTPEERQLAKAVNFGLIYGLGAKGLIARAKQDYGVTLTQEQAEQIRSKYFTAFSGLRTWQKKQGKERRTRTMSGRQRTWEKEPPYTQLLNTPVQGSGADGLKLALAKLWQSWNAELEGCFPVMAVHDELVIEAPKNQADRAAQWVKDAMIDGMSQVLSNVPVEVEITISRTYGGD